MAWSPASLQPPSRMSTSGQGSSLLLWDFSRKLYLSLSTIGSHSNLYMPQLEIIQSFFFFFNLKRWMCLPDSEVCKGAGLLS